MLTEEHIKCMISEQEFCKMGNKTTVCMTRLVNGFEIVTSSSCVNPDEYCEETGKEICHKRACDKIWELEGYMNQIGLCVQEASDLCEDSDECRTDSEVKGTDQVNCG